jgi:uncharacterized membrane protein
MSTEPVNKMGIDAVFRALVAIPADLIQNPVPFLLRSTSLGAAILGYLIGLYTTGDNTSALVFSVVAGLFALPVYSALTVAQPRSAA